MRYWENTEGTFTAIPSTWSKAVLKKAPRLRLGNRAWVRNFISYSPRWGSLSVYYLSEDGEWLIRVSDHWSEAGSHRTKTCGGIRSCYWTLKSSKHNPYGRFTGGAIRLADLHATC